MKILVLLFSLFIVVSAQALTSTLQDTSYLRKLSMHVRGYPPAPVEYKELKSAQQSGAVDSFFDKKIKEYLSTDEHALKLQVRLEELFRLKTMSSLPGVIDPKQDPAGYKENALNNLFLSLAKENLSWDQLLLGKKYSFTDAKVWGGMSDFEFIRALLPQIPASSSDINKDMQSYSHQFAATDNRIGGALTTARFFNRYNTTQMNKNRKRAAAIFNIFLCDSMSPAIPEPPSDPSELLKKAFPVEKTEQELKNELAVNDLHGSQQSCMQCHYKLDPMGQVFAKSTVGLSTSMAFGKLTFKEAKGGKLVDQPVTGIGALGAAITKQQQYVDCQVKNFWNWFIGSDRPLTEARSQELAKEFEKVGRKTNDFISVFLKSQEFRTREIRTAEQIRVDDVVSVLNRCTNCHSSEGVPDFTKWPIAGSADGMKKWTEKISKKLDLEHDGANRTMPPSFSGWQPTSEDLDLLKLWIQDGAPDDQGKVQI